jgi:hypothetical protein
MTKEEFDKIYDPNITKRDYDALKEQINMRFRKVVCLFNLKSKYGKYCWFDFANSGYECDDEGFFDENEYSEYIYINGDIKLPEPYGGVCEYRIPTRWLWTSDDDVKKEIETEVKRYKDEKELARVKAKLTRENRKKHLKDMKEVITSKLTKEELKCITFKK